MVVIVRWLLKFICISGSIVDNYWLLLNGGCCRQVSLVVSLEVWLTYVCYCKVVSVGSSLEVW